MKTKIVLIYAICLILLGLIGFYKSCSLMSLYSGGGFGLLLLLSAFGMKKGKRWAFLAAPILTGLMTVVFILRTIMTHKALPFTLALLSLIVLFLLLRKDKRPNRGH